MDDEPSIRVPQYNDRDRSSPSSGASIRNTQPQSLQQQQQQSDSPSTLLISLNAERSMLRKEIRRAQTHQVRLSSRAEDLEVEVRTLEEAVDAREAARVEVQEESENILRQELLDQQAKNKQLESKIQKLKEHWDRKHVSLLWMQEHRDYLNRELHQMVSSAVQLIAMKRSEELSDKQALEQLDVRLGHRYHALCHVAAVQKRHASQFTVLQECAEDQIERVQEAARLKLRALDKEKSRLFGQFQKAHDAALQKRLHYEKPHGEVKLASCMYSSAVKSAVSHICSHEGDDDDATNSNVTMKSRGSTAEEVPSGPKGRRALVGTASNDSMQQKTARSSSSNSPRKATPRTSSTLPPQERRLPFTTGAAERFGSPPRALENIQHQVLKEEKVTTLGEQRNNSPPSPMARPVTESGQEQQSALSAVSLRHALHQAPPLLKRTQINARPKRNASPLTSPRPFSAGSSDAVARNDVRRSTKKL